MTLVNYLATGTILACSALMVSSVFRNPVLSYWNGVRLGFSYFIGGPFFLLLIFGRIKQVDIDVENIRIDGNSTIYILCACSALIIALLPEKTIRISNPLSRRPIHNSKKLTIYIAVFYILLTAHSFYTSGKLSGGHWYSSHGEAMEGNAIAVALAHLRNVIRFALPFLLLFALKNGLLNQRRFIFFLICLSVLELIASGNRVITLMCLLAYIFSGNRLSKKSLILFAAAIPLIIQFNSFFPIVRGLMWSEGFNIGAITQAFNSGRQYAKTQEGSDIELILSAAFEASNLNMASQVVEIYPSQRQYLYGETFLLRPFVFFLPRAIWPDRPNGFGLTLGEIFEPRREGLALNSTYLGEAYANFGIFTIFILPCVLWLISSIFRNFSAPIYQYMSFGIGLSGWRFDLVFSVVGLALFCIIAIFSKHFRKRSRTSDTPSVAAPNCPEKS